MALNPLVSSNFDSGNIICDNKTDITTDGINVTINCQIKQEPFTAGTDKKQHSQWFHFKVSNVESTALTINITNAGETSYPAGWPNYKMRYSYDRINWYQAADTTYDQGILTARHECTTGSIWFAYFAPYSYEQHQALIGRCAQSEYCSLTSLGHTLDGRDIDLLTISDLPVNPIDPKKDSRPHFWITARQHPGESMAEWCAEGFLERLLSPDDALAKKLRAECVFYIVPNANPDGSIRGHLRTNACGANLNREWAPTGEYDAPTVERSPEIYYILQALDAYGCDGFLDIHGDEEIEGKRKEMRCFFLDLFFLLRTTSSYLLNQIDYLNLPANFLNKGTNGAATIDNVLEQQHTAFRETLLLVNPDFQTEKDYGKKKPGTRNVTICSAQITVRFGCFAATLEQPFKDCTDEYPQPKCGWNPERSKRLGWTLLDAFNAVAVQQQTSTTTTSEGKL